MKLIHEIPLELVKTDYVEALHGFGFTLIWGATTLKIYKEAV
jgi:hypothetical protein